MDTIGSIAAAVIAAAAVIGWAVIAAMVFAGKRPPPREISPTRPS